MLRILLSSVFGPFGVDDAYGRKENIMELFHNQVTREQGLYSLRFNHPSFGLHLLAANVDVPVTVLDFPSERRFVEEIRKGYDYVGISFITPNFVKAKRMGELVRLHAPDSKILLGGHGTRIPDLEQLVEHDHICRGEGVRWLRELLGERVDRPIRHPAVPAALSKRILGVPLRTDAAVLIPGVGCPNGCRFCATSEFFDRSYTPFFDTGAELYEACRQIERDTGYQDFFVLDENFLKRPRRARELLRLMEEHDKPYRFGIFSSAETIAEIGVEFLARLGVYFVWMGVESKREVYDKNRGLDLKAMIAELRAHGIYVLASGILFLEHHDEDTIWEDIEYVSGLGADLVQFMQLGPLPTTPLYVDYDRRGLLRHDLPYEEWHGQHRLWFDHPNFSPERSEHLLRAAFRYDYDTNGPSFLRMCDTQVRGARTLARSMDPWLAIRARQLRETAQHWRPTLDAQLTHAHNEASRALAEQVIAHYERVLGPASPKQRLMAQGVQLFALRERARRTMTQPPTQHTSYGSPLRALVPARPRSGGLSAVDLLPHYLRARAARALESLDAGLRPLLAALARLPVRSARGA